MVINYCYFLYILYIVYVLFIHLLNKITTIKINKMKSQLFKSAWLIFKKYNLTFSQALVKAWSDVKRQRLINAYNAIRSTAQYAKKKAEAKKLWMNCNVSFQLTLRNICNNDGAIRYYDGLTLNMD